MALENAAFSQKWRSKARLSPFHKRTDGTPVCTLYAAISRFSDEWTQKTARTAPRVFGDCPPYYRDSRPRPSPLRPLHLLCLQYAHFMRLSTPPCAIHARGAHTISRKKCAANAKQNGRVGTAIPGNSHRRAWRSLQFPNQQQQIGYQNIRPPLQQEQSICIARQVQHRLGCP